MIANVKWTLGVVVLASTVVSAQAQQPSGTPATPAAPAVTTTPVPATADEIAALKPRMHIFEQLVLEAVDSGGQRFAQWARSIAPIELAPTSMTTVTSVYLPESGSMAFVVQLPEIRATSVEIWLMAQRQYRSIAPGPGAQRVGSQSIVQADPMGSGSSGGTSNTSSAAGSCPSMSRSADPIQVYSDCVKDALYNVLLDAASVLPVKAGQWVTLQADPGDDTGGNPLAPAPSHKLILSVRGEDLIALQQSKLTRDQARKRILETLF